MFCILIKKTFFFPKLVKTNIHNFVTTGKTLEFNIVSEINAVSSSKNSTWWIAVVGWSPADTMLKWPVKHQLKIKINTGMFFQPQVHTPHLIHSAQIIWAFGDRMLCPSPHSQGVYSQENINISWNMGVHYSSFYHAASWGKTCSVQCWKGSSLTRSHKLQ